MLTAVPKSGDKKTGPIAVTYRAGPSMFGSCPASCALNPKPETSTNRIDWPYFNAVLSAVPTHGQSFMYCHFHWRRWHKRSRQVGGTVVNFSADTWEQAKAAVKAGVPTVLHVPHDQTAKVQRYKGIRGVVCPATYSDIQCSTCGGGRPLCARERDYVVLFPAHGAAKKQAASTDKGGCYAAGGNVRMHWKRLSKQPGSDDGAIVSKFAASLPSGSILRHHIAGDVGEWE